MDPGPSTRGSCRRAALRLTVCADSADDRIVNVTELVWIASDPPRTLSHLSRVARLRLTMKEVRVAAAALSVLCLALGAWSSACSSTTGGAEPQGGSTSSSGSGSSSGAGADGASNPMPDSGHDNLDAGASADCGHPPKLLDASAVGLHCPNLTEGGAPGTCAAGEHCCEQSSAAGVPSTCASSCADVDAEADWACQDPSQCGSGLACCGKGIVKTLAGCTFPEVSKFTGTRCAASCAASEFVVCEQSSECPSGQTCRAAKARGGELGICR